MRLRHLVSKAEILRSSSAFIDQVSLEYKAIGIMRELKSRTFREVDRVLFFQIGKRFLKLALARPSLRLIDFEQSLSEVRRLPR
jgi:hypothetical protein